MRQNSIPEIFDKDGQTEYQFDYETGTALIQGEDDESAFITIFPAGEKREECQKQIAKIRSQLENLTGYELRGLR